MIAMDDGNYEEESVVLGLAADTLDDLGAGLLANALRRLDYHVLGDQEGRAIAISRIVAEQLVFIAKSLEAGAYGEAQDALYHICDPSLSRTDGWKALEDIAMGNFTVRYILPALCSGDKSDCPKNEGLGCDCPPA